MTIEYRYSILSLTGKPDAGMALDLPSTRAAWRKVCEDQKLEKFPSGSKFHKEAFYKLRILSSRKDRENIFLENREILLLNLEEKWEREFEQHLLMKALRKATTGDAKRWTDSWTTERSIVARNFGPCLEMLCQIATRPVGQFSDKSRPTIDKITTPGKASGSRACRNNKGLQPDTPTRFAPQKGSIWNKSRKSTPDSPPSLSGNELGENSSDESEESSENDDMAENSLLGDDSLVDPEMDKVRTKSKEKAFQQGDEQTVNACLVSLLQVVSNILGHRNRVHLDRKRMIMKSIKNKELYTARVDGLITSEGNAPSVQAFMEVKRSLRLLDIGIRMQEGSQMAAFIQMLSADQLRQAQEDHAQELASRSKSKYAFQNPSHQVVKSD
ncbi:hypothetical protein OEA41_007159 [Lepraria neglecta]|uniref:Uncharacterized protein n=1 Tax=Lepraria neglecta TaxID=209136 RepID=A0AAD9ZCI7_9LECA|nr:hypothetical protein OEA41_007159 [Lepraria neglecta]